MTMTLDALKAAFKQPESNNSGNGLPNNYYRFWDMKEGESVTVRFLPDANPDNPFGFFVEKLMHTLDINGQKKSVPCLKMYDEDCPICKISSQYYRNEDKVNGKKYWRKRQYITQALIVDDPLPPDETTGETHEGKIRYLALGYQIYNVIKEAIESGELDEIPFAFKGGCDFIIKKSRQGEYSTYAVGSRFARKTTDLTDEQIAQAEEGMIDLATLLPAHPGVEKVETMLQSALTGSVVDNSSASSDDVPWEESTSSSPAPATASKKEEAPQTVSEEDADDILAQIRARRKQKAS